MGTKDPQQSQAVFWRRRQKPRAAAPHPICKNKIDQDKVS